MPLIRSLALLLSLLSLAACEQAANPPAQPQSAAVEAPATVHDEALDAQPAAPAVSPSTLDSAPAPKAPAAARPKPTPAVVVPKPEPSEPKAPLDLSLHPDVFESLQPLEPPSDLSTTLLPPLFDENAAPDSPFQLNGKLITNERGDDYWQSVEGAQLQFEFKR